MYVQRLDARMDKLEKANLFVEKNSSQITSFDDRSHTELIFQENFRPLHGSPQRQYDMICMMLVVSDFPTFIRLPFDAGASWHSTTLHDEDAFIRVQILVFI